MNNDVVILDVTGDVINSPVNNAIDSQHQIQTSDTMMRCRVFWSFLWEIPRLPGSIFDSSMASLEKSIVQEENAYPAEESNLTTSSYICHIFAQGVTNTLLELASHEALASMERAGVDKKLLDFFIYGIFIAKMGNDLHNAQINRKIIADLRVGDVNIDRTLELEQEMARYHTERLANDLRDYFTSRSDAKI